MGPFLLFSGPSLRSDGLGPVFGKSLLESASLSLWSPRPSSLRRFDGSFSGFSIFDVFKTLGVQKPRTTPPSKHPKERSDVGSRPVRGERERPPVIEEESGSRLSRSVSVPPGEGHVHSTPRPSLPSPFSVRPWFPVRPSPVPGTTSHRPFLVSRGPLCFSSIHPPPDVSTPEPLDSTLTLVFSPATDFETRKS